MLAAFKKYLLTLKLSQISRKLYHSDVRRFLIWLGAEPTLDQVFSTKSYTRYMENLRKESIAPSIPKRTMASLRQFGTFVSLTYSVPNPMSSFGEDTKPAVKPMDPMFLNYIKHFTKYLVSHHLSPLTIKSYKSDITRYLDWSTTHLIGNKITELLRDQNIKKYLKYLAESGSTLPSTIDRKEKSLARFATWVSELNPRPSVSDNITLPKKHTLTPPTHKERKNDGMYTAFDYPRVNPDVKPTIQEEKQSLTFINRVKNRDYRKDLSALWTPNLRNLITLGILLLFVATLSIFGYRQFTRDVSLTAAFPSTPVTPNRQLSFQGRLEDAGGTPITTATDISFKLFTLAAGGVELYSSGICSITPDSDGVFSTQIGSTCGAGIPSSVFTENSNVWLEVTVETEVLDPRQHIATVAYALNSETIQGFPISATVSAVRNTVVPMNQWGEIIVGETNPRMTGVSGTYTISAPSLSLTTTTGSNGNITLDPDGTGQIFLSSLTTVGADLYVTGGISTFGTAVTDGTVEATRFCTGDGETNCVTDFSAISGGSLIWTDAGTYLYATNGEVLGNAASAGANKIAGLYLADSSPLVFGTDNDVTFNFSGTELAVSQGNNDVNFDGNTLFVDGSADRVGFGTTGPDARIDSLTTSGEQLRLTYTDGSVFSGFTTDSSGNLTIDNTGTKTVIADDLQISGDDLIMGTNTSGFILVADGTNFNPVAMSGDVTINSSGVSAIGADKITEAMLKSVNGPTDELCLSYESTTGDFEWQTCGSGGGGSSNWRINLGSLSPNNDTLDVLVGGNSTASARAAFLNIDSGTPTASVSAGVAGAAFLNATGTLATTAMQTLALGNATTGNVVIAPGGVTALTASGSLLTTAADLYVTGGISTFGTAVTDGTVEATRFCTGDGETNCVTNFAALTSGASIWTDAGTYIYPTNGEVLGNSASAGANKLAGLYLADSAPVVFGTDNDVTYSFSGTTLGVTMGTNDINYDANTLFIDGSANNIGIGDITPVSALTVGDGDLFQVNSSGIIVAIDGVAHTIDDVAGNLTLTSNSTAVSVADDLYVSSGISTFGTAVSDGTIEATKFCTGDGETNCITDFSAVSAGSTIWTDAGTYIYPTAGEVLGNSASAGANKLAGIYLADSSPLVFGTDNDVTYTFSGTELGITQGTNDINFDANTLFIDGSANNIGIGTTAPDAALEINHATGDNLRLTYNDSDGSAINFTDFSLASDGKLTIDSSGGSIIFGTDDDLIPTLGAGSADIGSIALPWDNVYATVFTQNGNLVCDVSGANCPAGTNWWDQTSGTIQPYNKTVDLLIGGAATESAKFAFINVNSGTPTASVSAGTAGATYLTATGVLATTAKQTLALGDATTTGNIILQGGNVGIGVASPTQKLEVNGYIVAQRFVDSASSTYYLDPAATGTSLIVEGNIISNDAFTISSNATNGDITIDAGTGTVFIGATGAGKLDAGTIDPPYTINGEKFASYMAGMTGVKEETTGTVRATEFMPGAGYRATLDFANSLTGSDLWLFAKTTDLKQTLDKMVVLLSTSSNTRTWYEIDPAGGKLYLYSTSPTTISYRLTAPRFDTDKWENTRDSASVGHEITDHDPWSVSETIAAIITAGQSELNTLFGNVETNLISPLASGSAITITAPVVIAPPQISDTPALAVEGDLLVDGEIEASTISARLAQLEEIQAETITARNIVVDTIEANHIIGLDAKIASLSAGMTEDEITTITDRIKARISALSGTTPSAEDIPAPVEAESPDIIVPETDTLDLNSDIASTSAMITSLETDFVTINNYLAVIGHATITSLSVTDRLSVSTIESEVGTTLSLQPLGGTINLAAGTLIVDSIGEVAINGNLLVSGKVLAGSIESGSLSLGNAPEATPSSALGQLLSIYNEQGEAVATIDASGSANLSSVTTKLISITAGAEATPSSALSNTTANNSTAGQSKIISPNSELTIESKYITKDSLVYLTPTTNTDNQVLYVKAKNTCENLDPSICTPSFTVSVGIPALTDISFNWWIIEIKQ